MSGWSRQKGGRHQSLISRSYLDGEKERGPDEDHEDPTRSSRALRRDADVCFWHLADISFDFGLTAFASLGDLARMAPQPLGIGNHG
jgi:hypothetical protein